MKKFTPIAMKCTQEQFDAIRPKLVNCEITHVDDFKIYNYLTNYLNSLPKTGNTSTPKDFNRKVHETWNEKVFLEACGIETTPTIEEVKEYFKDADTIKCISDEKEYIINLESNMDFIMNNICFDKLKIKNSYHVDDCVVWNKFEGYAKIITYKKPIKKTYTITEDLIKEIASNGISCHFLMTENYPEVFDEEKAELPKNHTGWCKIDSKLNEKWLCYFLNGILKYGFDSYGEWFVPNTKNEKLGDEYHASEKEVSEALIKEAVKRGYKNGNYLCLLLPESTHKVDNICLYQENRLLLCDEKGEKGNVVFSNGKWAEVIEQKPMTQEEIEKELGYKIKIV
jgi:hypothetical protein